MFRHNMNAGLIRLIRSLPESIQTDAMIFLVEYGSLKPGNRFDFFHDIYTPAWSTSAWLLKKKVPTDESLSENTAYAMAMAILLHSLDDHLVDREVPLDHMLLALRSQAWALYQSSLTILKKEIKDGEETVKDHINRYYRYMTGQDAATLEEYADRFRDGMATWTLVPVLLSLPMEIDTSLITRCYETFGIAWRFLDDLQDYREDIQQARKTAPYLLLSGEGRDSWLRMNEPSEIPGLSDALEICHSMILDYLDKSKKYAREAGLNELSEETGSLLLSIKKTF